MSSCSKFAVWPSSSQWLSSCETKTQWRLHAHSGGLHAQMFIGTFLLTVAWLSTKGVAVVNIDLGLWSMVHTWCGMYASYTCLWGCPASGPGFTTGFTRVASLWRWGGLWAPTWLRTGSWTLVIFSGLVAQRLLTQVLATVLSHSSSAVYCMSYSGSLHSCRGSSLGLGMDFVVIHIYISQPGYSTSEGMTERAI